MVFTEEERGKLLAEEERFLRLFQLSQNAKRWLDGGPNAYDWGCSVVTKNPRYGEQWKDAVCISEYFYACFDIADTALPVAIANQRIETSRKKYSYVLESSQEIRHAVNLLHSDYTDLLVRCSSEGHRGLEMYHETWRMQSLLDGLKNKTNLLEELINAASERATRRNQEKVQYILVLITFLGVIGLFASLHDYLASGYDPGAPEILPRLALSISKVAVFSTSLIIAILAFVAYFLYNKKQ